MKNFLKGYASVLTLCPDMPAPKITIKIHSRHQGQQADADALKKDWEAIGKDMWGAINEYDTISKK